MPINFRNWLITVYLGDWRDLWAGVVNMDVPKSCAKFDDGGEEHRNGFTYTKIAQKFDAYFGAS